MTEELPSPTLPSSRLRGIIKCFLFVLVTAVMFVPIMLSWALGFDKLRARLTQMFFFIIGRVSGLRITVEGTVCKERPIMLVANHASYLDIFSLGSIAPVSFTPKLEIRSWPIIGFFCVLADCVFIERRPADMQRAQAEMAARLNKGKALALFPEGTTGDGLHVMPFKSGFLKLVESHQLPLQPVSIAYTHVADIPLSAATRDHVAWIGDADFVTHYWRLLKLPSVTVQVTFYDVKRIADYADRKDLARTCEDVIRAGLTATLTARGIVS